jgi:hypothetical protein
MVDRTITASSWQLSMFITNDRSILISLIGSCRR